MNVESQRMEMALLDDIEPEEFVRVLVTLIKNNLEVQGAIMGLVLVLPYIVRRF